MADVAQAASVSHGLVFHYFGDKHGLYLEVLRSVTDQLVAATAPTPDRTPMEQLYFGLNAHVDFAERYPHAYTAFLHGGNGADQAVELIIEQARARGLRHVLDALAVTDPQPRLEIALRGWQSFTEGAIIAWLRSRCLPRAELLDMLAAALADAVRAGGLELPPTLSAPPSERVRLGSGEARVP
jgi:AcrR family transcriptional regulator